MSTSADGDCADGVGECAAGDCAAAGGGTCVDWSTGMSLVSNTPRGECVGGTAGGVTGDDFATAGCLGETCTPALPSPRLPPPPPSNTDRAWATRDVRCCTKGACVSSV